MLHDIKGKRGIFIFYSLSISRILFVKLDLMRRKGPNLVGLFARFSFNIACNELYRNCRIVGTEQIRRRPSTLKKSNNSNFGG